MLGLFKRKPENYFSEEEKQVVMDAVKQAELRTSGEIRVYVESHCRFVDPVMRSRELFQSLKMYETAARNAVLIYVAMKDRQLAVYGDEGIHAKVGDIFWNQQVQQMLQHFNKSNYALGIATMAKAIGEALQAHFPYDAATDVNELPDDIVFGK